MPLSEKQREDIEDTIMDLHFTSEKYVSSGKDIHRKLLEVNVQEAIDILKEIREDMVDDPKRYDYKMHLFLPFQLYELAIIREREED